MAPIFCHVFCQKEKFNQWRRFSVGEAREDFKQTLTTTVLFFPLQFVGCISYRPAMVNDKFRYTVNAMGSDF